MFCVDQDEYSLAYIVTYNESLQKYLPERMKEVTDAQKVDIVVTPLTQDEALQRYEAGGHAIEVRLTAEDPRHADLPQSGTLHAWRAPEGVRCDHALADGCAVAPFYDSMLAKLVVWGPTRDIAIARMRRALRETYVGGIRTNVSFLDEVLQDSRFVAGGYDTGLLGDWSFSQDENQRLQSILEAVAVLDAAGEGTASPSQTAPRSSSQWKGFARRAGVGRGIS